MRPDAKVYLWFEWTNGAPVSLNRRDLIKLGGAAFVASLVPDQLIKLLGARDIQSAMSRLSDWDIPADAVINIGALGVIHQQNEKRIWNGTLFSGQNSELEILYEIPYLYQMARETYGGAVIAEWPDNSTRPNQAWYALFGASARADTGKAFQNGWFQFDWETMTANDSQTSTQAERLTSASDMLAIYQGIKAVLPELKFGFYSYPLYRDYFQSGTLPGHVSYTNWQSANSDWAAVYPYVDAFFPSFYWPYSRKNHGPQNVSGFRNFLLTQIHEQYRLIKTYGRPDQAVYPFINWTEAANGVNDLDLDVWHEIVRACYELTDGFVLWGGSGAWSTGKTQPWYTKVIEPMLTTGRRPAKALR